MIQGIQNDLIFYVGVPVKRVAEPENDCTQQLEKAMIRQGVECNA